MSTQGKRTILKATLIGFGVLLAFPVASQAGFRQSTIETRAVEHILKERFAEKHEHYAPGLAKHLVSVAQSYEFDPAFVLSVIHVESSFRPKAVSKAGAIGLMQLLPATAKYIADKYQIKEYKKRADLFNPYINIKLGVAYFAYLRDRFSHFSRYVAAYNLGPTTVGKMVKNKNFQLGVIRNYVRNIYRNVGEMRKSGAQVIASNSET